nr:hypothetical protein [Dictyobacter vulcani]
MAATAMRTISLPGGEQIPVLGQGTWGMGNARSDARKKLRLYGWALNSA